MKKEDLNIEIDKGHLTVSGERKVNDSKNSYYSIETGFGKFSRSFQLPENINEDKINAKHQDGILYISVMKDPKSIVKKTIHIK